MIQAIRKFVQSLDVDESEDSDVTLAAAALLIEVMLIDGKSAEAEQQSLRLILHRLFALSDEALDEITTLAHQEIHEATSLYQFTREINDQFDHDKKLQLMVALWQVALADGYLDKHEEHIVRRIADLIHIRHSEFIRCKQLARGEN